LQSIKIAMSGRNALRASTIKEGLAPPLMFQLINLSPFPSGFLITVASHRVKGELLAAAKAGRLADLWFLPIPEVHRRAHIERATISYLQPIWNRIRY
jgi:hypothetical protein